MSYFVDFMIIYVLVDTEEPIALTSFLEKI
jgi:hypothetical protein